MGQLSLVIVIGSVAAIAPLAGDWAVLPTQSVSDPPPPACTVIA